MGKGAKFRECLQTYEQISAGVKNDKCPTHPMKTAVKSVGGVRGTIKASWVTDIPRKRRRQVDSCLRICRHTRPAVLGTGMSYRWEEEEVRIWRARQRNKQLYERQ